MNKKDRLTCAKCHDKFPNVPILKCNKSIPGGITLCSSCHRRLHSRCDLAVSAVTNLDKMCSACLSVQSVIVCPQCVNFDDSETSIQLCQACSSSLHDDFNTCHQDHFQPMPSQT